MAVDEATPSAWPQPEGGEKTVSEQVVSLRLKDKPFEELSTGSVQPAEAQPIEAQFRSAEEPRPDPRAGLLLIVATCGGFWLAVGLAAAFLIG